MAPKKKEGPDQARSWAIAFAACVINTLISGFSRANGLFYVALVDSYGVSRMQANLPFTVRNVVRNLAGPLVGVIGQRYGPRDVTIVGGVLASLGIILCTFAPNVIWITIFWGGIHGLGVAFSNTLFQVVVTQYFLKYRATASGLAMSGACIGAIFFPILMEYMLANLGLTGTFLVTGGIIMHVLPASIMLVEPPWVRKQKPQVMSMIQEKSHLSVGSCKDTSVDKMKKSSSSGNLDKFEKQNSVASNVNGVTKGIDNPAFDGYRVNLNEKKSEEADEETVPSERLRAISFGEVSINIPVSSQLQETSISKGMLKMLRDPMFHMMSLSISAFAMVYDASITVIVDYFMDKGFKEDVALYFISIMSLGDLVGKTGFGWVTDKNYMSVPKFMMTLQVGLGVCTMLLPMFNNFDYLMTVVVIYGLLSGATMVMFPILIGRYLQSVQSLAIGFSSFFTGLLSLSVPLMIGYFRDKIGSYDGMFYISGGLSIVIGFLWLIEPLLLRLGQRIRKEQSVSIIISSH